MKRYEIVNPDEVDSFIKEHQDLIPSLSEIADQLIPAFTDKGKPPLLSLRYELDCSEEARVFPEYLVIEVWIEMEPEEAFYRMKRFNRWWLNLPNWNQLREHIAIDISFLSS